MDNENKDTEKQETETKEASEALKQDKKKKLDKKKKKEKPKTEIEILQDKNKKLEKQITEEKNKFAFLQADLENTRKHYIKQQEWVRNRTKINTITSFTPLIDSFEMALKSKEKIVKQDDDTNCQQMDIFIDGFEKLYENLKTIFDKFGVKPIEETNIPLDYRQHETIMKIINDEVPEDTVLQIVAKGYKMNGEVIRPAKVVVSKKTPIKLSPKPISEIHELSTDEISSENIEKKLEENKKDDKEKPTPFE
jgi:molecular chaperone GrpE